MEQYIIYSHTYGLITYVKATPCLLEMIAVYFWYYSSGLNTLTRNILCTYLSVWEPSCGLLVEEEQE